MVRVDARVDLTCRVQRAHALGQELEPAVVEAGDDVLDLRLARAQLRGEGGQRAARALGVVDFDDPAPPRLPFPPGGQVAELRLLFGQYLVGFVLGDGEQQVGLAVGEVVEQLALAGRGGGSDVVEADVGDALFPERVLCGALDDLALVAAPLDVSTRSM